MRWFKHLSNSRNDECISELCDEFGLAGYGFWWIVLELIAEQMDKTDKCSARFSNKKWAKECGISPKKFQKMLEFLSNLGKLSYKICKKNENFLIIECPNLLKFRDEYTKKSGQPQKKQQEKISSDNPPETETETETETKNKSFVENSDEFQLAKFLYDRIKERKPDFKNPNMQTWAKQIDYMIRIDARDPTQIRSVIEICQNDPFWQSNILSTKKLREKYDMLTDKLQTITENQQQDNTKYGRGVSQSDKDEFYKQMEQL